MLHAASNQFDATLLSTFKIMDGQADKAGMCAAAEASWDLSPNRPRHIDWEWKLGSGLLPWFCTLITIGGETAW